MSTESPEAIRRRTKARIAEAAAAAVKPVESEPEDFSDEISDDGVSTSGGLPGAAVTPTLMSEERMPVAKFTDTAPPAAVAAPAPAPAVVAPVFRDSDPYRNWLRGVQGQQLSHLRGVNLARLDYVYLDRLEAAFRAGYAAGVDDGI